MFGRARAPGDPRALWAIALAAVLVVAALGVAAWRDREAPSQALPGLAAQLGAGEAPDFDGLKVGAPGASGARVVRLGRSELWRVHALADPGGLIVEVAAWREAGDVASATAQVDALIAARRDAPSRPLGPADAPPPTRSRVPLTAYAAWAASPGPTLVIGRRDAEVVVISALPSR